ncbi:enzymatic polyprotein [Plakobranchus ocellatus]|uniref:Enzymatic polyprotein n=1 Tax=Plakobranchus ocellatus TaxID=259542 RepID=A0AAV3YDK5_9GAST|nr:enzymatic polyprotein [Plakobranchus ocellatus]
MSSSTRVVFSPLVDVFGLPDFGSSPRPVRPSPNQIKIIDDTLIWSDDIDSSFFRAVEWLDTCGKHGIILNPEKFVFTKESVMFAGFKFTLTTVGPCPQSIRAIRDFPTPKNLTDICSWFGLVNQVWYAFASAEKMSPFCKLIKPGSRFVWTEELDRPFEETKDLIINEICKGIEIFDKNRPTCLATDWSKDGVGFWLFQKHCKCKSSKPFCCNQGWKITLVGSRFTSGTESRYAPIEREALAIIHALSKARHFVIGCADLIVAVDQRPLLKVFGDRSLDDLPNPRLCNLKEKTLHYRFRIVHVPGIRHTAADAVGEPTSLDLPDDVAPVSAPSEENQPTLPTTFLAALHIKEEGIPKICTESVPPPATVIKSSRSHGTMSAWQLQVTRPCKKLIQAIEDGFPMSKNVPVQRQSGQL